MEAHTAGTAVLPYAMLEKHLWRVPADPCLRRLHLQLPLLLAFRVYVVKHAEFFHGNGSQRVRCLVFLAVLQSTQI
jgi:hypothetical protein